MAFLSQSIIYSGSSFLINFIGLEFKEKQFLNFKWPIPNAKNLLTYLLRIINFSPSFKALRLEITSSHLKISS